MNTDMKTLTRTQATHAASGHTVSGYEIHHGQSAVCAAEEMFRNDDGTICGVASDDGRIWATYMHGVFDADAFRRWFVDRLRERRGLAPVGRICATNDIEAALDRLADVVREALDMKEIYRVMGL